ncbi:Ribonuclease H1 [Rhizina undulata]
MVEKSNELIELQSHRSEQEAQNNKLIGYLPPGTKLIHDPVEARIVQPRTFYPSMLGLPEAFEPFTPKSVTLYNHDNLVRNLFKLHGTFDNGKVKPDAMSILVMASGIYIPPPEEAEQPRAAFGVFFGPNSALNENCPINGDPRSYLVSKFDSDSSALIAISAAINGADQYRMEMAKNGRPPFRNIVVGTSNTFAYRCFTEWVKRWKRRGWALPDGGPIPHRRLLEKMDKVVDGMERGKRKVKIKFWLVSQDLLSESTDLADMALRGVIIGRGISDFSGGDELDKEYDKELDPVGTTKRKPERESTSIFWDMHFMEDLTTAKRNSMQNQQGVLTYNWGNSDNAPQSYSGISGNQEKPNPQNDTFALEGSGAKNTLENPSNKHLSYGYLRLSSTSNFLYGNGPNLFSEDQYGRNATEGRESIGEKGKIIVTENYTVYPC